MRDFQNSDLTMYSEVGIYKRKKSKILKLVFFWLSSSKSWFLTSFFSWILLFYLVESVCTFFVFSISSFINSHLGFKHATSIDGQGAADAVATIKSFSGPFLLLNMGNTGYTVSTHDIMHVMRRLLLKTHLTIHSLLNQPPVTPSRWWSLLLALSLFRVVVSGNNFIVLAKFSSG